MWGLLSYQLFDLLEVFADYNTTTTICILTRFNDPDILKIRMSSLLLLFKLLKLLFESVKFRIIQAILYHKGQWHYFERVSSLRLIVIFHVKKEMLLVT